MERLLFEVLLPLTLLGAMFGMGMTLTLHDFLRLQQHPRALVAGLSGQLVLLPLVAAGLAAVWGLGPELAVGLVLLAACPGGTTSNIISHLANGDRPLSITLTALSSCAVIFTIPLYVTLAMDYFVGAGPGDVSVPVLPIMLGVFIYTILPVSLGMVVRARAPRFAQWCRPYSDRLTGVAFLLIILIMVWSGRNDLVAMIPMVAGVTFALFLVMTALGMLLARLVAVELRQALTIGIEVGVQNTVLGMTVAATLLDGVRGLKGEVMLIPAAVYGLVVFLPVMALIAFGRRKLRAQDRAASDGFGVPR